MGYLLTKLLLFVLVAFVIGLVVGRFPVASTLFGLVLFIGQVAYYVFIRGQAIRVPEIIITVLIIAGLVKSLQSVLAIRRDEREADSLSNPVS